MDSNPWAIFWEALRSGLGLGFLWMQGDRFGSSAYLTSVKYILGAYFILSLVVTGWFVIKHRKEDNSINP